MKSPAGDNKNSAYLVMLEELRNLIRKNYENGGRLPPARELSRSLGTSLTTYGKAIRRLQEEGTVYKRGNRGIFVYAKSLRTKKLGIVIDNGKTSPFWISPDFFGKVLGPLEEFGLSMQILQASSPKQLQKQAGQQGIDAVLWFAPKSEYFPVIREFIRTSRIPLMLIDWLNPLTPEDIAGDDCNYIRFDYPYIGHCRAECLAGYGHKKILYAGSLWFAEYNTFFQELKKFGLDCPEDARFSTSEEVYARLRRCVIQHGITAVYSEGPLNLTQSVYHELSSLPEKIRPELFVTRYPKQFHLQKLYPNVKVLGDCGQDIEPLAQEVARQVTAWCLNGKSFHPARVRSFAYRRFL